MSWFRLLKRGWVVLYQMSESLRPPVNMRVIIHEAVLSFYSGSCTLAFKFLQ